MPSSYNAKNKKFLPRFYIILHSELIFLIGFIIIIMSSLISVSPKNDFNIIKNTTIYVGHNITIGLFNIFTAFICLTQGKYFYFNFKIF